MTNNKKAVNSLPVVSLIGAHFSPSGKGNLPLYSLCYSGLAAHEVSVNKTTIKQ